MYNFVRFVLYVLIVITIAFGAIAFFNEAWGRTLIFISIAGVLVFVKQFLAARHKEKRLL